MGGKEGDVGAVDLGKPVLMRLRWMGEAFVAVEPSLAVVGANDKAAGAASGVEHGVFGFADAEGVDNVHEVFVGVVLAELVAFLRLDEALENTAQNIGANRFEVEGAKVLEDGAPGVQGVFVAEDVRPTPILFRRVEEGFVVTGGVNCELKRLLEVEVEVVGGGGFAGNVELFEFVEFGADGFVKEEAVGEDVAECAGGAVNESAPRLRVVANNRPALVTGHPFLEEGVKSFGAGGLGPEKLGSKFHWP